VGAAADDGTASAAPTGLPDALGVEPGTVPPNGMCGVTLPPESLGDDNSFGPAMIPVTTSDATTVHTRFRGQTRFGFAQGRDCVPSPTAPASVTLLPVQLPVGLRGQVDPWTVGPPAGVAGSLLLPLAVSSRCRAEGSL